MALLDKEESVDIAGCIIDATLIDEILNDFYQKNYWGYSLPNYISAAHNAHPNYAGYLNDKNTLTIEGMNEIFDMMDEEKKVSYDKRYIEELYLKYMEMGKVQEEHKAELKERLFGTTVVLVAPGKSSLEEKNKIQCLASQDNVVLISVNFACQIASPPKNGHKNSPDCSEHEKSTGCQPMLLNQYFNLQTGIYSYLYSFGISI